MSAYRDAIERFEKAVRAHAMRGTQMPGDQPGIELEYQSAKQALIDRLSYRKAAEEKRLAKFKATHDRNGHKNGESY